MKIQALLFDSFDELDLFGVFEILRMVPFDVEFRMLGCGQETACDSVRGEVIAAYGARIACDKSISIDDKPELLIVPGGGWLTKASKGAWAEAEKGDILKVLIALNNAGTTLVSVCTGSLLLARAGLLTGRQATTNHAAINDLVSMGALYVDARVVDDGNIITAAGITSSLDLGLWLVERFVSAERAKQISQDVEFERRGPIVSKNYPA